MKKEIKEIIILSIFIILAISLIYLLFFQGRYCLEEKAEEYCEDNDLSYYSIGFLPTFFVCEEENDPHIDYRFSFTKEEEKDCRLLV